MKSKLLVITVFVLTVILIAFFMLLPEPSLKLDADKKTDELSQEYKGSFIIRNVQVYDGHFRHKKADVKIIDNKISVIAEKLPEQSKSIGQSKLPELDAAGKTLLPGLIDSHTHAYQNALSEALNFGVTTELDMFTMPSFANPHQQQRKSLENTSAADLFSATILATAPQGHGTQYGFDIPVLHSVEQIPQFVADRIKQGADYIKAVYNSKNAKRQHFPSISAEILKALIDSAHQQDRVLVVHVDNLVSAREAITLGANGIIHSFVDQVVDKEFVELMLSRKSFIIPTLSVKASMTQQSESEQLLKSNSNEPYLSKQQHQQLTARFPGFGISSKTLQTEALQNAFRSVELLSGAKVPVLSGSDAPNPGTTHGLSLHGELELLVRAGLTNEQALHSATGAVGHHFPIGSRGTLSVGSSASMILVDGNPFESISSTQKIVRIWKNGVQFERTQFGAPDMHAQKFKPGLITDFNRHLNQTNMGKGLGETTDKLAGGKSTVKIALVEHEHTANVKARNEDTNQYLKVRGELKPGFMFPWSGIAYLLGETQQNGVNLSAVNSIVFKAKASAQTKQLSVLLFQTGSFRPIQKDVELSEQWQTYHLKLSELKDVDLTDISNISFVKTRTIGEFEFMLDDLYFE